MTKASGDPDSAALHHESRRKAPLGAVDYLSLAAAPTFAFMALLTGLWGTADMARICSGAQDARWLSGMTPMYWLMSAFHAAPWLKLFAGR